MSRFGRELRENWTIWLVMAFGLLGQHQPLEAQISFGQQRYEYELSNVLPGASVFERVDHHWKGYASESRSQLLGYVFLTDDLVDIPGYSGETINTLVGMDSQGMITGIQIVGHSEPIVLIGVSEASVHEFTAQYPGMQIADRILINNQPKPDYVSIDGISGATVTAVAANLTILEASRLVGRAEGVLSAAAVRKERPSSEFETLSWKQLVSLDAIGALTVGPDEFVDNDRIQSVDVRFAVLDPPTVGQNLLGKRFFELVQQRQEQNGGSAVYIGGVGDLSFKGAGFARGGIFDRFVLEQAGNLFVFRDLDYIAFPVLTALGAPRFREGGIFFTDETFDPTQPFSFRLTVPYRVQDERHYETFVAEHQLPSRFVESNVPFWVTRWQVSWIAVLFTLLMLGFLIFIFAARGRLILHRSILHRSAAILVAVIFGLMLKAQLSTTQILTLVNSVRRFEFPTTTFLSEPLIFMMWIVTVVTLLIWGRGFFCGWVCPYGALLESLRIAWEKVAPNELRMKIDGWRPPEYFSRVKIAIFAIILLVSLVNLPVAEALNEIEPFKTFLLGLTRPWAFVLYFAIITLASVVSYRFFCRFLCPLGGALAITSTRAPLLPLVRYETCTSCQICAKTCEPNAISFETGRINYQECLQCWKCQETGLNENVCPELIKRKIENRPLRLMVASGLLALFVWPTVIHAETRRVSPGTLSEALNSADAGDLLLLESGIHEGPLHITKSITLRGEAGSIIDGLGIGHIVIVDAPGAAIENLTLRNCRVSETVADAGVWVEKTATKARVAGNTITGCRFGVWLHGASQTEVADNRVIGLEKLSQTERGDCIHLWDADGASVTNNELSYCRDGVYMELTSDGDVAGNHITQSRYGVHSMWCDNSRYSGNYTHGNLVGLALMFATRIEAKGNILHNNRAHGLLWVQVTRGSADSNIIIGNTKGMFVYNSLYNTIRGNLVARNNLGSHYWGGSEENVMRDNAFIENEIQVKFVAAKDQVWDSNFWSDYGGWDMDDDGRGEVPYRSNTLVDALLWNYPLSKLLLASPAFQVLAVAEREFPVITVPKVTDLSPQMSPSMTNWKALLDHYPAQPSQYYLEMEKLPHVPGSHH